MAGDDELGSTLSDGSSAQTDPGDDTVAAPQGFGERLAGSFGALILGIVLVPLACIGLFWNEGHAVAVAKALAEAGTLVRPAPTDRRDPALDGRLVHVAGPAGSAKGVSDDALGVRAPGLALHRRVEMYQWRETESGSGSDRKFTYRREWSESAIPSDRFRASSGHENPGFPGARSRSFGAADALIDAFPVGAAAVQLLSPTDEVVPDDAGAAALQRALGRPVRAGGGTYFAGREPETPRVGDLRIGYTRVPEGPASFVGKQEASGLETYRTTNGQEVLLAGLGTRSAAELVAQGQEDNRILAWILRAVGLAVLLLGFCCLFAPVNLLAGFIPILGSLVEGATVLIALAATVLVGPTVIASAWLAYRPLLAVGIIAGAVLAAFGLRALRRRGPGPRLSPAR